jgi:hypothetical protein
MAREQRLMKGRPAPFALHLDALNEKKEQTCNHQNETDPFHRTHVCCLPLSVPSGIGLEIPQKAATILQGPSSLNAAILAFFAMPAIDRQDI